MKPVLIWVEKLDEDKVVAQRDEMSYMIFKAYDEGYSDGYNAALAEVYKNEKRSES